jgi:chemotaxis protein methyltransferase CheR
MPNETMDSRTFKAFRELFYDKAGISINDNKVALVTARVGKRMRQLSISEHRHYLDFLLADETGGELIHLLDAISTNVTSFFRENAHFDFLGVLVDRLRDEGQKKFRFWSAASSTGEEPYSLAMVVLERLGGSSADVKILATDLSTRVLARCAEAMYPQEKTGPVPVELLRKYFEKRTLPEGVFHAVRPEVRNLVTFSRLNLSKPPFPMNGPFDAVFCRNVMIYFDTAVRKNLLAEISRLLRPGGHLFVGHAESLTGMLSGFRTVQPSVYVKP